MSLSICFNGRLGRDAEVKTTNNGTQFVSLNLATDVFANGATTTVWLNVSDFTERTLKIVQYLTKGKLVNVVGDYSDRIYMNKENVPQIARDVRSYRIDFVSSGQSGSTESITTTMESKPQVTPTINVAPQPMPSVSMMSAASSSSNNDDLPF